MAMMQLHGLAVDERLHDITLSIEQGEMVAIVGPNGAGKTTLMHCLAGIQAHQGEIELDNTSLADLSLQQRAQQMSLLPQQAQSAWSLKVADVIAMGRIPWNDENADIIQQAAQQGEVEDLLDHRIDKLSGGEQSRVWLARALAGQPKILLADEPVASLDLYYQRKIMQLLRAYAQQSRSVIFTIHDLALAARYCDKICLLHQGRIFAWGKPEAVITEANLQAVFQVGAHVDMQANPPIISYK